MGGQIPGVLPVAPPGMGGQLDRGHRRGEERSAQPVGGNQPSLQDPAILQQTQRGPPRGRQWRGEGKGWDIFPGDFSESAAAGKEASSIPVTPLEKQQQQPVSPAPLSPHSATPMTVLPQPPTVMPLPSLSKTNSRMVPPTAVLRERLKAAPGFIIPSIKGSKRKGGLTLGQRGVIRQKSIGGGQKRKIRVTRARGAPSLTLRSESLYSVSAREGEEGDNRSVCTSALEEAPPLSLAEEEGEGGYIFSEKEGGMVLAGTKRSPEAQKRWEEERRKERDESLEQRGEVWPADQPVSSSFSPSSSAGVNVEESGKGFKGEV
uniref:Uncharacterized protein n=1 Tax=Chromera velia CCMP2878 TaxID=1169474 RepID=A0A0G4I8E5_9ALVE|eukprot:Cvel_11927.t1-p1 / transcript=Cvel_11927.t1 / gene=Cvel_11927 / organism=Chromera_velia_CCMP2878 / gene_product=hypothetical protein / transcript_product=hypothetical protein / location=Cvel_scaffold764:29461-31229(+) / protein_length=318 / sequence_SO=supercontig / SO=protein_coding / is_pseudo=false